MTERYCKRCDKTLPLEAFNRQRDGYQWWCRECFRAYFRDRGDLHRGQALRSREARRRRAQEHVLAVLRESSCVDCGESHPVVLDFDHVSGKTREVSAMIIDAASPAGIDAEIAKCEVVCANCHRRRTYRRRGLDRTPASAEAITRWRRRRNMEIVYGRLSTAQCLDCGIRDPLVLEFDHVGVKRGDVMQMAWWEYSIEALDLEIANCEIRCANCHRRVTAERGGWYRHLATLHDEGPRSSVGRAGDF